MYSPKIRRELIPALYVHSKEVGVPMTNTVNRYIVQGFASEALSDEVEGKLPSAYLSHIKSLGFEELVANNWPKYAQRYGEDLETEPFKNVDEIMTWHNYSLRGVKKAYLGAELNRHHAKSTNQSVFNHNWLYRTLALNLNRGLSNALVNYSFKQ